MTPLPGARPVFDPASPAHAAFAAAAISAGLDPGDRWVGGYVDYEWDHLRKLLDAYRFDVGGRDVLEFGCNIGGSSVILAALGGRVTGIDPDRAAVAVAAANVARFGLGGAARMVHVPDTRALPFADAAFDAVFANSVLEYVAPEQLAAVLVELHRVLRPGGRLLICGTASRLAVREVHSRRWLVNYVPHAVDRLLGAPRQRGLAPWALARAIRGRFTDVTGLAWHDGRRLIHGRLSLPARLVALCAGALGLSPGWLAPNMEMLLRKADRL